MNYFKQKKTPLSILTYNFKHMPMMVMCQLVLTIMDGLILPIQVFLVASFIDHALGGHSNIYLYGGLLGLAYLYRVASGLIMGLLDKKVEDKLLVLLKPAMARLIHHVDYMTFEGPDYQDLIHRVSDQAPKKFIRIQKTLLSFLSVSIQLLGLVMVLGPYMKGFTLLVPIVLAPLVLVSMRGGRRVYSAEKDVAQLTRKMNYLSDVLTQRAYSHERTLFAFSPFLNKDYRQAHLYRTNYNTKALAREVSRSKTINIIINVALLGLLCLMIIKVSNQEMTVGIFSSLLGSLLVLSKVLSSRVSDLFLNLAGHQEYIRDLRDFSCIEAMEDQNEDLPLEDFESLVIQDLYFKYQGQEEYVLKGLNLTLKKGMSYSLVGINGSGKTSLTKIITGLYRNYEGLILLNGQDLRAYSSAQLRGFFGLVNQNFSKYQVSFKDNVCLGQGGKAYQSILDDLKLNELISGLKNKDDSPLGKLHPDGVDLSGGQWQKIAIARALYRPSGFLILDEPTSSLSPSSESMLYDQFMEVAKGSPLLMISHRLGSTKIADEIILMADGLVKEQGSHEDLMALGGHYAQLFSKQSRLYDEE